jgi:hypothetical protein
MNYGCKLMQVPKWMRLFLGWILIGIGLPLFVTPIPGGFLLGTAGVMLLFGASPSLRNRLWRWAAQHPWIARRLEPVFNACQVCPNERPGSRSSEVTTRVVVRRPAAEKTTRRRDMIA